MPVVLHVNGIITTPKALQTLVHFLCACSYLCKPYISRREVDKADELLVKFCAEFEQLYGKEAVTPNLHMHMHLKDCVLDAGPVYTFTFTFWCFSFERYNGMAFGTIYSAEEGDGGQKFWVDLLALRTLVRFSCACS